LNEAYLEILVVCSLNINSPETDPDNNPVNHVLRIALLLPAIMMLPLSIYIILQKETTLKELSFKEKWG
jgi:hypothetical protein